MVNLVSRIAQHTTVSELQYFSISNPNFTITSITNNIRSVTSNPLYWLEGYTLQRTTRIRTPIYMHASTTQQHYLEVYRITAPKFKNIPPPGGLPVVLALGVAGLAGCLSSLASAAVCVSNMSGWDSACGLGAGGWAVA